MSDGRLMAPPLPRLRPDLDIMPSPVKEQPGLLVRDPFHYSEMTLVVPPLLARCLGLFDGEHTELDLRAELTRLTGQVSVSQPAGHLVKALREAGFLDDDVFAQLRARKHDAFAAGAERAPAHAGSGYPDQAGALGRTLDGYLARGPAPSKPARGAKAKRAPLMGIAAPHVSPEGGIDSYAAAYRALPGGAELGQRTFVILGTSHYGEPDRFGLTRKPFATPFGVARTDAALVDELARAAGDAAHVEDYCHAVEHSIEFQVVFLQHLYGPDVRILPILCGTFADGPLNGRPPETSDAVARFLGALGELGARRAEQLFFVLGVDMTHIGRRYGDPLNARAGEGKLIEIEARDRQRISRLEAGDAAGFWDLVQDGSAAQRGYDQLKWCGSSPFYTFQRVCPGARGQLLHYEQWNIDDASVVSFGAMTFTSGR
jgi:AmmeMemoRadiSam system protein B